MDTVHGLDSERIDGRDDLAAREGNGAVASTIGGGANDGGENGGGENGGGRNNSGGNDCGSDNGDPGPAREATDAGMNDVMFDIGGDERRMHVRAYNHWVSLLKGRPYPSIADLEPETITDFGPHSVLLDFSHGMGDPKIAYLGRALREECGLEGPIATIADVPSRSLLSRLTDHYLQIIANRAPIGFEAEFVSSRGCTTLYRGILMPFTSGGATIDFIYGVINWKELADADLQSALAAELDAAVRSSPQSSADIAPVWADGPSGGFGMDQADDLGTVEPASPALDTTASLTPIAVPNGALGEQLAIARESAAQMRAAEARSRAALHRALGRAHDLAVSADTDGAAYAAMLSAAHGPGSTTPMEDVIALVFGGDFEATRRTELAAVLSHAKRHQVPVGGFSSFLSGFGNDLSVVAAAERAAEGF
ncbi:PAS domain-containing protein [Sphingomonas faeni]|uniref:PAS domain-containing protein n=1 Tax=Sphingomonas faeni TaxID=185950 RepID=UPI003361D4F1